MTPLNPRAHVLLVTGVPGVGKTTLVRRVAAAREDLHICGFYTEEIREGRDRVGFRAVTFGGDTLVIAHVHFPGRYRVGRYGVDVAAIESLVESSLTASLECVLYIVDEIGRMECLSTLFVSRMRGLLGSETPVLATIGLRGGGFLAEVKGRSDVQLLEVTRGNRETLADRAIEWVASAVGDLSA
jgi:nucleoside-triphosphatase